MIRHSNAIKEQARLLRSKGFTYAEINKKLNLTVPKPTFYFWFRDLVISEKGKKLLLDKIAKNLIAAQAKSATVRVEQRKKREIDAEERNSHLEKLFENEQARKAILGSLYLAEGTKGRSSGLTFGNSNPDIIRLFLSLLRTTYAIDERKFRVTVQARADQNIKKLESFWQQTTGISKEQFYTARIDPRSIGKKTQKTEHKGVCRLNYFSTDLLNEIQGIGRILVKGL